MCFYHCKPSALSYSEQHKTYLLYWWINNAVKSRYTSKMSRSAYHTSSMKSCQMVTSSVSSSISHWPLKAKSQLKKTKKAVSTKLLVYSSQLSAAHSSPPIDINVITMSSDEGVDKHSVDE